METHTTAPAKKISAAFACSLLVIAILVCGTDAKAGPQNTIWSSNAAPTVADGGPGPGVELGVKFRSDIAGTVTGLRFYKSAANIGTHIGNLWSSSGTLLATATFTNETASGWQQVSFSSPVAITANTVYVASYYATESHYSIDLNTFTSAGVDNPPLHALQNSVSGGNGVYMYSSTSTFPSKTYYSANYWVDVVFAPRAACPCTIWSDSTVPTSVDNGPDSPVELGVKFTSSNNGTISGIRFYKSSANTGTHVGNLWSSSGALLATATFSNETATGWQQVSFSSPVAIVANATYVASYHTMVGHYSSDLGFFSTTDAINPPLQALPNGMNGGNGVYMYGGGSGFPGNTYYSANYWVDVVFNNASQGNSSGSPTTVSVTPTLILGTSATALNLGIVNIGSNSVQTITLTNVGSGNVAISGISVSGPGFDASGVSSGTVLTPAQSVTLSATFAPAASGTVAGSITVGSNATGGPVVIALAGTGVAPVAHSVMLSWSPSTSTVVGYNVYVSTVSGSSYTKLTTSPVPAISYTDGGLETEETRYYVVTSVDSNNDESAMSNQVAAIVP